MNIISLIQKNRKLVLGRNERQLIYIRQHNLSRAKAIADNKLLTKIILKKADIPVPKKIKSIKSVNQLEEFDFDTLPPSFVVKPVRGVRGGGIEIFYNKDKNGKWIRGDKSRVSLEDLKSHCRDILDGKFSLFNEPDYVLIEERVRSHKNFRPYTYKGAPDVRVIVFNKIPIISYIRIPTKASIGKANLDLGAIGVGIDIAAGKTTHAIIGKATPIEYTEETRLPLSGIRIPYWDKILKYAIEASIATKLGFAAVDFLIDEDKGPMIVELNARPGLSIQLANDDGIRWRLKKAMGLKVKSVEHGIRLGKNLFGGEIEEEVEVLTGKQVIGLIENIEITGKDELTQKIKAKVDTGATISSIDEALAIELGFEDAINFSKTILNEIPSEYRDDLIAVKKYASDNKLNEKLESHPDIVGTAIIKSGSGITYRISIPIKLNISGVTIETYCTVVNRQHLDYRAIIGSKDLKKFIIDPSKK